MSSTTVDTGPNGVSVPAFTRSMSSARMTPAWYASTARIAAAAERVSARVHERQRPGWQAVETVHPK